MSRDELIKALLEQLTTDESKATASGEVVRMPALAPVPQSTAFRWTPRLAPVDCLIE